MRTARRYLAREIYRSCAVVLLALLGLFTLFAMVDDLDNVGEVHDDGAALHAGAGPSHPPVRPAAHRPADRRHPGAGRTGAAQRTGDPACVRRQRHAPAAHAVDRHHSADDRRGAAVRIRHALGRDEIRRSQPGPARQGGRRPPEQRLLVQGTHRQRRHPHHQYRRPEGRWPGGQHHAVRVQEEPDAVGAVDGARRRVLPWRPGAQGRVRDPPGRRGRRRAGQRPPPRIRRPPWSRCPSAPSTPR